jgi:hypothetical protein
MQRNVCVVCVDALPIIQFYTERVVCVDALHIIQLYTERVVCVDALHIIQLFTGRLQELDLIRDTFTFSAFVANCADINLC